MKWVSMSVLAALCSLMFLSAAGTGTALAAEKCVRVVRGEPSMWRYYGAIECRVLQRLYPVSRYVLAIVPGVKVSGGECVQVASEEPSHWTNSECTTAGEGTGGFAKVSESTYLPAEWLDNGAAITSAQLVESEGELLLGDTVLGVKVDILCSAIFVGSVGPSGEDELTEMLTLAGEAISKTPLVEPSLTCTNDENCAEALVWAVNLPWQSQLTLMEQGTESFFEDASSSENEAVGFYISCMSLGITDTCTASTTATNATNITGGVNAEATEAFTLLTGLSNANCETGGAEKGLVEGLSLILLTAGGTLTVSE